MNKNIECLIKSCNDLNIDFVTNHYTKNFVSVFLGQQEYLFVNRSVPLNSKSIDQLCIDKDFFYTYFKDIVNLPRTISLINPYCNESHKKYLRYGTFYEIIEKFEDCFDYPFIVKRNRGSWGNNVYLVSNQVELEKSLLAIFDKKSTSFDYVCLAQEHIKINTEYRVIYLNGEFKFAYKKITNNAKFVGNLSPLHWDGAEIQLATEFEIYKLKGFCAPVFNKINIPYCGLDVALDNQGTYWLIEANSSPSFDRFIESCGSEFVVDLYRSILIYLKNQQEANE